MAKIAIVDDTRRFAEAMQCIAQEAGHEVLTLVLDTITPLEDYAGQIISFCPDVVFLDHAIGRYPITGANIAALLTAQIQARLVGTSSYKSEQTYVHDHFEGKARLLTSEGEVPKQNFLRLCEPASAPSTI